MVFFLAEVLMMFQVSDKDLNVQLKTLVQKERTLLNEILLHIKEIDRRKLFLKMGFPSLYEYLTKEIGYSAGAAQRRIDAARFSEKVPEVLDQIKAGSLNLSQISKVQQAIRLVKKETGQTVELSVQKNILTKLQNKSSTQTDLVLAREFQLPIKTEEKTKIQRDESVRVEITFTKEEMALIEEARALLSNKTGGVLKETILELARKALKRRKPLEQSSVLKQLKHRKNAVTAAAAVPPEGEKPPDVEKQILKSVTPKLRNRILTRDKCCQFQEPSTGKICGSTFYLEVDHIHPKSRGGMNTEENLRAMCKNHNIYRYHAGI